MEPTFDVYLNGELLAGFTREKVVVDLAQLFKLEQDAANTLVNGQRRRVKSACAKAAALQYRTALTSIGLGVSIQRHGSGAERNEQAPEANPQTSAAAEKSAKARSVLDSLLPPNTSSARANFETSSPTDAPTETDQRAPTAEQLAHIASAKNQTPGEHAKFEAYHPGDKPIEFDSVEAPRQSLMESLSIAPVGSVMSEHTPERPYKLVTPPDYEVAPPGEPIPTLEKPVEPLNPSIDHLHLQPVDKGPEE